MSFVYAYLVIGAIFTFSHVLEDGLEDFSVSEVIFIHTFVSCPMIVIYPLVYHSMWKEGSLWNNKV